MRYQLAQQYIGGSRAGAKGRFRSGLNHSKPPHYQTPSGPGFVVASSGVSSSIECPAAPIEGTTCPSVRAPSLMGRPIRLTSSLGGKFEGRTETETQGGRERRERMNRGLPAPWGRFDSAVIT